MDAIKSVLQLVNRRAIIEADEWKGLMEIVQGVDLTHRTLSKGE